MVAVTIRSRCVPRGRRAFCALSRNGHSAGFTLVELLGVVAVIGILAAIGVTSSRGALERGRNGQAIAEILAIDVQIQGYRSAYDSLPASLAGIGKAGTLDPWGNPYEYGRISDLKGAVRKDRFLHPLNSDFDLFSKGADGLSKAPLTDSDSKDDLIRANDGHFVGLGSQY
jgi:general secretion pathway protein G